MTPAIHPPDPYRPRPFSGVGDRTARTVLAISLGSLIGMSLYDLTLVFPLPGDGEFNPGQLPVLLGVLVFTFTFAHARLAHLGSPCAWYPANAWSIRVLWAALAVLALCAANIPFALWLTALREAWELIPLMLYSVGIGVWALVRLPMGLRDVERAPAAPPEVPKLLGLRDPARMPPGWCPVVFHRSVHHPFGRLPLEIDGEAVGSLDPGGPLVVGLPPGRHTARVQWDDSPSCAFSVAPDGIVHFTVETGLHLGASGYICRLAPYAAGPVGDTGPT